VSNHAATVQAAIRLIVRAALLNTSQTFAAGVTVAFLIAVVLDAVLSYTLEGCDHSRIRRSSVLHTGLAREELVHVPQVLSSEGRTKSGLFDGPCARPVGRLSWTVGLIVKLVVDLGGFLLSPQPFCI
jgi:hypothetical protein